MAISAFLKSGIRFPKSILGLFLLAAVLPASATIVIYADSAYLDSPHYLTRSHWGASSLTTISASTSPQVSYNLRRAHAWSQYQGQTGPGFEGALGSNVIIVNQRPTSIQANMARARAYSSR